MVSPNSNLAESNGKSISLVLGAGGARGLAHIGVIHWLLENGYQINSISGCSIGACIGGIYAIGKLPDYTDWVTQIKFRDIIGYLDFTLGRSGLVKGDRLFNTLRGLMGDHNIESLDIPFTAVAVDINRNKETWIQHGSLFDAIRASTSIPLLFTPVKSGSRILVDGAVLNPIPIAPTMADNTDMTIAINVSGDAEVLHQRKDEDDETESDNPIRTKIDGFLQQYLGTSSDKLLQGKEKRKSISDVVYQSYDAMQIAIARQKLAAHPPDVLIELPNNMAGMLEFHRAEELISHGYERTAKVMGTR